MFLLLIIGSFLIVNCKKFDDTSNLNCKIPTKKYSLSTITELLDVPSLYNNKIQSYKANVHVNIAPVGEPAEWLKVTSFTGITRQFYNDTLGTLQGDLFINISNVMVGPLLVWYFNILKNSKPDYCLHFIDNTVPEYIQGDITANNLFTNTYILNENTTNGLLHPGDSSKTEYFWFSDDSHSVNGVTAFSTTIPLTESTLSNFKFTTMTKKRNVHDFVFGSLPNDSTAIDIGKFKIPVSLIASSELPRYQTVSYP